MENIQEVLIEIRELKKRVNLTLRSSLEEEEILLKTISQNLEVQKDCNLLYKILLKLVLIDLKKQLKRVDKLIKSSIKKIDYLSEKESALEGMLA